MNLQSRYELEIARDAAGAEISTIKPKTKTMEVLGRALGSQEAQALPGVQTTHGRDGLPTIQAYARPLQQEPADAEIPGETAMRQRPKLIDPAGWGQQLTPSRHNGAHCCGSSCPASAQSSILNLE
jgi:hypothetical protein